MKYYIGQKVRIGGSKGAIMIIADIKEGVIKVTSDDGRCVGYLSKGDCSIVPVKEVKYEQLTLF